MLVLLEIGEQIHGERELTIQSVIVQGAHRLFGVFGIFVLQEAVALGVAVIVHRIEYVRDLATGRKQLLDDRFQFLLARRVHLRDVIDNDNILDAVGLAGPLSQQIAQQFYGLPTKCRKRGREREIQREGVREKHNFFKKKPKHDQTWLLHRQYSEN